MLFDGSNRECYMVTIHDQHGVQFYRWVEAEVIKFIMEPSWATFWMRLCRETYKEAKKVQRPVAPAFNYHRRRISLQALVGGALSEREAVRNKVSGRTGCLPKAYLNAVGTLLSDSGSGA